MHTELAKVVAAGVDGASVGGLHVREAIGHERMNRLEKTTCWAVRKLPRSRIPKPLPGALWFSRTYGT
ncbi:MAG: hypothetical protein Rubg2KO_22470 [Rubricoccaceae bacterium]